MEQIEPTGHQLRAAIRVAAIIDASGNSVLAARQAYQNAITDGEHHPDDLVVAERILLRAGLLVRREDDLYPTDGMRVLASLQPAQALFALAAATGVPLPVGGAALADELFTPDIQALRDALGAAGELAVVEGCRAQLEELGRADLAHQVQRVSVISDALGYDVAAPRTDENTRLLEVKTQLGEPAGSVRFFISRHEFETGRAQTEWSLVACFAPSGADDEILIAGWCTAEALRPHLPDDRGAGRWTEARVSLPMRVLHRGLPSAVG